jgi:hypothetical protein
VWFEEATAENFAAYWLMFLVHTFLVRYRLSAGVEEVSGAMTGVVASPLSRQVRRTDAFDSTCREEKVIACADDGSTVRFLI